MDWAINLIRQLTLIEWPTLAFHLVIVIGVVDADLGIAGALTYHERGVSTGFPIQAERRSWGRPRAREMLGGSPGRSPLRRDLSTGQ